MQKPTHKDWLFVANEDLLGAKRLASDRAILSPAFFLTQQGVEKALKGYLLFKQQPLLSTHDLALLLKECSKFDANFLSFFDHVTQLGGYLTSTRYPDDAWYVPDEPTLVEAIELAEQVIRFVESLV